jgi:hypothetical protein
MTLVIGTDEAGYGPNLGPLVVAATAWRVAAGPDEAEKPLADAVEDASTAAGGGRLWDDSKEVYRAGDGMAALERGVLAGLLLAGDAPPAGWPALERSVGAISPPDDSPGHWEELTSLVLPTAATVADCAAAAAAARDPLARHAVSLCRVACRCIYPREFNALLGRGLNKSDILSQATLDLAAALRATAAGESALVWCDRHGGRKRYGGLVARHFDAALVRPLEETPTRSAYDVPAAARAACRVEFCVGGESRPPVALASMTAKYVRELAMLTFNAFWSGRQPGLAPTAGYPTDAVRWRKDAAATIAREGIADDDLWRRA